MNINLGLYDIFSTIVPGFVYLLFFHELGKLFGFEITYSQFPEGISLAVVLTLSAFILGHLLNRITYHYFYRYVERYSITRKRALVELRKGYPSLKIHFEQDDAEILLSVIQHHRFQVSEKLERHRANGIMMRNLSFGFALFSLIPFVKLIQNWFDWQYLLFVFVLVYFAFLSMRRAIDFAYWFYRDIFREGLNFGISIEQVLKNSRDLTLEKVKK